MDSHYVERNFKFRDNFFFVETAPRNSGKSHFIYVFLRSAHARKYPTIYYLSTSLNLNHDIDEFLDDPRFKFYEEITKDIINTIFNEMRDCKAKVVARERHIKKKENQLGYSFRRRRKQRCPENLLILDDAIDSGVFNFRGVVDKIAERGRHVNLSCIISAQRLSSVSRSIRINADYFMIFLPFDMQEIEQFLERFVPKSSRKLAAIWIEEIFNSEFYFIMVDNTERQIKNKLKAGKAELLLSHGKYSTFREFEESVTGNMEE